jgi:drug/metabolite transporter (DMT)-like permease
MLFLSPAFFSTNVVFGRAILSVEPFTLAFLRWGITSLILLALCRNDWQKMLDVFQNNKRLSFASGFLAFWVCGGMVYFALHYTSATNGTLIYTTPPILIMLIETIWRGRHISGREIVGICLAVAGVFVIVFRGEAENLASFDFNDGDLIFIAAAVSWAIYSVFLKAKPFEPLDTVPLLALVSLCGTVILAPFAAYEMITTGKFPASSHEWTFIAGIVVFSSLLSFSTFQYGIKILGASIAGIFMYLLPPWGLLFAWLVLGEQLENFHVIGTLLIMGGIVCATLPLKLLRGKKLSR